MPRALPPLLPSLPLLPITVGTTWIWGLTGKLTWLPRIDDKIVQKKNIHSLQQALGQTQLLPLAGAPQASSPLSCPKVRLLSPFHFLLACHLGSPSIKEWVGMHEKLKCVITYSPSVPLASLRVICLLFYLVTRVHCAWLSLISIPHKPCCSRRLSKLKYQTFVRNHFLSHYHAKDYES